MPGVDLTPVSVSDRELTQVCECSDYGTTPDTMAAANPVAQSYHLS